MRQTLQKIFLVTTPQLIAALILGVAIFVVEYSPVILKSLGDNAGTGDVVAQQTVSDHVRQTLSQISLLQNADNAVSAIMWAIGGLFIYGMYLFFGNAFITARNEVLVEKHMADSSASGKLRALQRASGKVAALIGYLAFVVISMAALIGYWMNMLSIFAYSGLATSSLHYFFFGLAGLVANLYLLFALAFIIWKYEESL